MDPFSIVNVALAFFPIQMVECELHDCWPLLLVCLGCRAEGRNGHSDPPLPNPLTLHSTQSKSLDKGFQRQMPHHESGIKTKKSLGRRAEPIMTYKAVVLHGFEMHGFEMHGFEMHVRTAVIA
jgi:hypothetical protein